MLKLYYSKGSCSLAVIILIKELGIDCAYESVDLKNKRTATGEDFLAINPKGYVPALLLENQQMLTENAVIQQYLADTYATEFTQHLLPPVGNLNRYRVLEWLNYITTELHKAFSPFFSSKFSDSMKQEHFMPLLKQKLNFVNAALEKKQYLVSHDFSIADSYLYVLLAWLPGIELDIKDWPNLANYAQHLNKRASIQAAHKQESL